MAGAYGEGVPVFFCGFIWIGVIKLNRQQKDKFVELLFDKNINMMR